METSGTEPKEDVAGFVVVPEGATLLCRLCAESKPSVIPIYDELALQYNLEEKINEYLPVKVSKSDELPLLLCTKCYNILMEYDTLRKTCIAAEEKLKEISEKSHADDDHLGFETEWEEEDPKAKTPKFMKTDLFTECPKCKCLFPKDMDMEEHEKCCDEIILEDDALHQEEKEPEKRRIPMVSTSALLKAIMSKIECPEKVDGDPRFGQFWIAGDDYICKKCEDVSNHKLDFIKHRKQSCPFNHFECNTCNATYHKRTRLRRHLKVHITTRNFVCSECNYAFAASGDLNRHFASQHTKEYHFVCDKCPRQFKRKDYLRKHLQARHGQPMYDELAMPYICEHCAKGCLTEAMLVTHLRREHGLGDNLNLPCELCGKQFAHHKGLRMHLRFCSSGKPIKKPISSRKIQCPFCTKRCLNQRSYEFHLSVKHSKDGGNYFCETCLKRFHYPSDLKAHQWTHTKGRTMLCGICAKSFKYKGDLTRHIRMVHQGLKGTGIKRRRRPKAEVVAIDSVDDDKLTIDLQDFPNLAGRFVKISDNITIKSE